MKTIVSAIVIVLGLPKNGAHALIERMNAILAAMLAHTGLFTAPPVALSVVQTHVTALETAQTATKSRAPGSIATRDAAIKVVREDAKQLHGYVQQLANANPTEAANIAADAAMTVRKLAAHVKHDLTVKQGVSGTIHVMAKSVKGARSHEWQYSSDGGKTWTNAPPTAQAHATIDNLPPGTLMHFRQRVITRLGPGDWSPAISMAVS
jgi:hypothetical protein